MKRTAPQYFRFPRQLLNSPAWAILNINERRAFDRLMEEHQSKSGFVNDGLAVTSRNFVSAGVPPRHVKGSMAALVNLGIFKCTRSMGGSKSGRTPNMWKPTFLPTTPTVDDATHDYLEIRTREDAKAIAEIYRFHDPRKGRMPQKHRKLRKVSSPSIVAIGTET